MLGVEQLDQQTLDSLLFPWLPPEVMPQVRQRLSSDQLALVDKGEQPGVGNLFPNFAWVMQATAAGPLCSFRTWNPVGPGKFELWSWTVGHPGASAELKAATANGHTRTFGITGMIEQDDVTIWSRMQRARSGAMGGEQFVDYSSTRPPDKTNYLADGGDFPGPGTVWRGPGASAAADDAIWQFFLRWYDLMTRQ
jgi:3-phenylpropionate/trans-cinnamate dioxygenase alpha subunit